MKLYFDEINLGSSEGAVRQAVTTKFKIVLLCLFFFILSRKMKFKI